MAKISKRDEIIVVARELFIEKGFNHVTMQDIAEQAGVSRGGLYHHFSSPGEIVETIMEMENDMYAELLKTPISEDDAFNNISNLLIYIKDEVFGKQHILFYVYHQYFMSTDKKKLRENIKKRINIIYTSLLPNMEMILTDKTLAKFMTTHIINVFRGLILHNKVEHVSKAYLDFEFQLMMDTIRTLKPKNKGEKTC